MSPDLDDLMKRALHLGADICILDSYEGLTAQVRFAKGNITAAKTWRNESIGVFMVKDGRTLGTTLSDIESADRIIADLLDVSKTVPKNDSFKDVYDGDCRKELSRVPHFSPIELVEMAEDVMNGAIEEGAKSSAGVILSQSGTRELLSSKGPRGREVSTSIDISVRAMCEDDETGHAVQSSTTSDIESDGTGRRAGQIAASAKDPVQGKDGIADVILMPLFNADIMARVSGFLSSYNLDIGMSPFIGKMGKAIASPSLSVNDIGPMEGSVNHSTFDDEGHPTMTTSLIKDGIMSGVLHNTSTALSKGTRSTGNAGLVAPRPWNTVISAGSSSFDEMLEVLGNGYIITNTWYTRFQNWQEGSFSTMPRDAMFRVENGRIVGAVKGMRLVGTFDDLLKGIELVGNDPEQVNKWGASHPVFTPSLLVRNVTLTSASG